jgi:hypothetical protein
MKKSYVALILFIFGLNKTANAQFLITKSGSNFVLNGAVNLVLNNENYQNDGAASIDALSTTYLIGNTNVVISGASGITFGNLVVNNSSGVTAVTLNRRIFTASLVTFTNGVVVTGNGSYLTFNAASTVTGASDASHANMTVQKAGGIDFTFPVGNALYYRLAAVTAHTSVDTFSTTYYRADPHPPYGTPMDPTINHVSSNEYWIINRGGVTDNAKVTLSWNSNTSGTISNINDIIVARWNGSIWKDHSGTAQTGTTLNGTVITPAVVTAFSPFTLASTTSASLPIELIDFRASCETGEVLISWVTGSEINNSHFNVEKSTDAKTFQLLHKVEGAGNSQSPLSYSIVDKTPPSKSTYYRLSQFDYDNTRTEVGLIALNTVNCKELKNSIDYVFATPQEVKIMYSSTHEGELITSIYSSNGSVLHSFHNQVSKGSNTININVSDFAAGMYYINCKQNADFNTTKIAIIK